MILTYKTGEPVWLGDHVLAAGTPAVIRSFTWNKDYSVRLYIENISGKSLSTIDVIPEDNRSLLPADTSVACDSEWKNVSFLKRGEIRYVTSGVPVKVGDVVAVEQSFGLMKLC
ncbi:MAG: hypothetical protein K6B46_02110 [Opitutales bacterium]|nr:hypothetical protein [Opitutales bacterium]